MKIKDLFCGAGGAAMGLHRAFPKAEIIGVDINPQPRYPFKFIQADALTISLDDADYVWASPMCQHHSWAARRWKKKWPNQIPAIRKRLKSSGKLYTIENVVGAPLINPVRLCGTMFNLEVIRHRLFESNFTVVEPEHIRCSGLIASGACFTVAGHGAQSKSYRYEDWARAMGIDWMTKVELTQSVPPAYSEYIAHHAKNLLR